MQKKQIRRFIVLRIIFIFLLIVMAVNGTCGEHIKSSELALEAFLKEDYENSAKLYKQVLKTDPSNTSIRCMFQHAEENNFAQVQVGNAPNYFEKELLLARPLIEGLPLEPTSSLNNSGLNNSNFKRFLSFCSKIVSYPVSKSTNFLLLAYGRLAGYKDRIWTNWYKRPEILGCITTGYMREQLYTNNLVNVYPSGYLVGFQLKDQRIPEGVRQYRTANGSWNNLNNPMEGAAGTRLMRNIPVISIPTPEELITPNPREISRHLLTRTGPMKEVPFLNMLAAAWIQFMVHDWFNHGDLFRDEVYSIPLTEDDPARKFYGQTELLVPKTQTDPTRMPGIESTSLTFINAVTHWWDGSQIYGSDQKTQNKIRSNVDGKLILNKDGTLPLDKNGIAITGFSGNWWVGLELLHTLFAREHNAICDKLKNQYPHMNDAQLFNISRLINAAVMAKIHTVEWTPAILPNQTLQTNMNTNWYGALNYLLQDPKHRKVLTDFKLKDPVLGGEVGNPIDKHGKPFGFPEEFVEVYRLHSLLPESLMLHRLDDDKLKELPFSMSRLAGSAKIRNEYTVADLFSSFGAQNPGQLVLNNYPKFMQELSIKGNPFYDLGAVDILRARERGVPRYNEFRRQYGLNPIKTFSDLTDDKEHVKELRIVYEDDVEQLDLMIGTLAESHRPSGYGFGETMYQVFILNASRRLIADRFYTDSYNEETYTKIGIEWVDKTDFKTVLLRHYPELNSTGLNNIQNAFEPWDKGKLDLSRHPLLAFQTVLHK